VLKTPLGGFLQGMIGRAETSCPPRPTVALRRLRQHAQRFPGVGAAGVARNATTRSRRTCATCSAASTAPASTWASATPSGAEGATDRAQLLELKEQLRRAVDNENFELAAELRDRIRVLE